METDIPLRVLTVTCTEDLLPLLGDADATIVRVESLELPALATRLDNVLFLRDRLGNIYIHLVEWQGYRDPRFLWRVLGYLGWLGQNRQERPICVTLIYLRRGDDVGDSLRQELNGLLNWGITFRCVRLWEEHAVDAVRSERIGLAVLSPLMDGADAALVEEAARLVLAMEPEPGRQADLLNILGVLAEPLVTPERFVALVGRERLMASGLMDLLLRERLAEVEQEYARERAREHAEWEQERARERAEREQERAEVTASLARAVEAMVSVRFPEAPLALTNALDRVSDPRALRTLLDVAERAPDLATIQQAIEAAAG